MKKYVILPSSSDLNRGDQALVWETIKIAQNANCIGDYYMLASETNWTQQSQSTGINILSPILKHPSRRFKSKENNEYNLSLLLKWGVVALFDLIYSVFLLISPLRSIVKLFMSKEDKNTLQIIEESSACFVKGGGFIHSAGKITDTYIVYFQLFHILLAQSLGKTVYIMPNSFGPFSGIGVKWLVKRALKNCSLVTVRESISKSMLDSIGVKSNLFPDLGFSLEKNKRENPELALIRNKYPGREIVALTARPYRFPNSKDPLEKYNEYLNGMAYFSDWLFDNGYYPIFIEHTLSETTHENDSTAIKEITYFLKNQYSVISDNDFNCKDLKSIYSEMDYVIGTRFHSVIFSLSENIPSIAITYGGNKGKGIMKDIGMSNYSISMSDFNGKEATKIFKNLTNSREKIIHDLKNINEQIKKKHDVLSMYIKKIEGSNI